MKKVLFILLACSLLSYSTFQKKKIKIFLAGDSTMSIKETKAYPETGWGMPFVYFWDSTVTVVNKAKNGRSTSSFRDEGLWQQIMDEISPGDYVFIQFGHNDEVPTKKTATTPTTFKNNLIQYSREVKAKEGIPILLTPVARRRFDSVSHRLAESHKIYSRIVREVAKTESVALIDLDAESQKLLEKLGYENAALLYNHLKPGEHPNYPDGKTDDTHFNELGARKVAEIVLAGIRNLNFELKDRIINRK
ncbi:MAG: rhamnogalacturonan acetylesterase [Sphingobacteriales bacterium]|jgi:lysophospholipase L1-like esterase|nr:rhamnogalacturonan acetylesterase [Sphingobacteriales bacterium]